MSNETKRTKRIALLRGCIERQVTARAKLTREIKELDEAMQDTLREYMDLVAPKLPEETPT